MSLQSIGSISQRQRDACRECAEQSILSLSLPLPFQKREHPMLKQSNVYLRVHACNRRSRVPRWTHIYLIPLMSFGRWRDLTAGIARKAIPARDVRSRGSHARALRCELDRLSWRNGENGIRQAALHNPLSHTSSVSDLSLSATLYTDALLSLCLCGPSSYTCTNACVSSYARTCTHTPSYFYLFMVSLFDLVLLTISLRNSFHTVHSLIFRCHWQMRFYFLCLFSFLRDCQWFMKRIFETITLCIIMRVRKL